MWTLTYYHPGLGREVKRSTKRKFQDEATAIEWLHSLSIELGTPIPKQSIKAERSPSAPVVIAQVAVSMLVCTVFLGIGFGFVSGISRGLSEGLFVRVYDAILKLSVDDDASRRSHPHEVN